MTIHIFPITRFRFIDGPGDYQMQIAEQIDLLVQQRALLNHPFYQSWTMGTLPKPVLTAYAAQYFRQVDAFPRYVSGVHSNCEDIRARQYLLDNLNDEERGEDNHPALWLRFAAALGLTEADVRNTQPWPETVAMTETFGRLTKDKNYRRGLAALLAYEGQIPGVAAAKIDGLKRFYGIDSAEAVRFFAVHLEADVWHSQTSRDLLNATTPVSEHQDILAAATEARDALWNFLDGALSRALPLAA